MGTGGRRVSRHARIALAIVGAALVVVVGVVVWMARTDQPAGAPIPEPAEARSVVADPSIDLPNLVEVPGNADGCPAAAFSSPEGPTSVSDGYAAVMLPRGDDAALMTACIGAVDDVGSVDEFVPKLWAGDGPGGDAAGGEALSIERVISPFGAALAVTSRIGTSLLTDHYVERDGWVYAVGYLRAEADGDVDRPVVDAVLASWEWR